MAVSDRVKSGPEKAPHRSLWKALGLTDEEAECTLRALGRVAEFFRRGAPERG